LLHALGGLGQQFPVERDPGGGAVDVAQVCQQQAWLGSAAQPCGESTDDVG
jgi:hypothetical protein